MEPEARIDRMERDGVLSPSQAEMLRLSLHGNGDRKDAGATRHNKIPFWLLAAAAAAAVIGLFVFTGNGGEQAVQDVATSINQPGGYGEMNKALSTGLAILVLLIVPILLWVWFHNDLVSKEEEVFEAWAQTESNFQRRADLIPALIDTVSRYLKHESETLTEVTAERSAAVASITGAIDELIEAQKSAAEQQIQGGPEIVERDDALKELYAAQARVGRGMTQLFGVMESYPELRSSDQFLELQAQLEGTENRINVARMRFNDAVRDYNAAMRRLPGSLVANVGSFQRKAYFQSDEEARDAPELQFD
ncbi:MAG: LemA family protein [Alphaproteobacteria bacterium]|nr:LemA family protein [Alphaproteobacteria bacterium]